MLLPYTMKHKFYVHILPSSVQSHVKHFLLIVVENKEHKVYAINSFCFYFVTEQSSKPICTFSTFAF